MIRPVSCRKLGLPKDCTDLEYRLAYGKYFLKQKKEREKRAKLRAKERKAKTRARRAVSLPVLIKKADAVFSKWIRTRDGYKCVLCGSTETIQNGHLFKRRHKAIRWDEMNCFALCSGCNYKDNIDHDIYVAWFLKRFGQDKYLELDTKARAEYKLTREHLLGIIERYKL